MLANVVGLAGLTAVAAWYGAGREAAITAGPGAPPAASPGGRGLLPVEGVTQLTSGNVSRSTGRQFVTSGTPRVYRVNLPPGDEGARMQLRVSVSGYRPSPDGTSQFRVDVRAGDGKRIANAGTFSIFPVKSFEPGGSQQPMGFGFDLTQALADIGARQGPVDIVITAASRATAASGSARHDELIVEQVMVEARVFGR